ncbi:MAG: type II secretion system protein [Clostridia bacterium]|nr:type II secretion system protein [Clostridia bacterium]
MRHNKKGFSYVELIIVMGMLAALMSISSISFVNAWRARASQAVNTAAAVMSQSKVNALSGEDNYMQIAYYEKDGNGHDKDGFYAELFKKDYGESDYSATPQKSQFLCNSRVSISLDGNELDEDNCIRLRFKMNDGSVDYLEMTGVTEESDFDSVPEGNIDIYFNQLDLKLYKITGEHEIS